jgi:hypothetical protein
MSKHKFAVVTPSKKPQNLIPCLRAVRANEPTAPIVVVDDGLGQQGIDQAMFFEPIEIAGGARPFVFARNVNRGIAAAAMKWPGIEGFVLLNDDALLESPNGFDMLARCCCDGVGIIGATTNVTGQPLQHRRPWLSDGRQVPIRVVPSIAFVCVYIPATTIKLVGLLDERFVEYGWEDNDYCRRVTNAGLLVAVHDCCYVDHSRLTSTFRGRSWDAGKIAAGKKIYDEKWNA